MRSAAIRTTVRASSVTVETLEHRRFLSGTTYYLSPGGNDTNLGTTPATAWKTITRANHSTFEPGDSLLLQGGKTFAGDLILSAADSGTAAAKVSIGSYGSGQATISAGNGDAITADDTGEIVISNLILVGSGPKSNKGSGLDLMDDQSNKPKIANISIQNINASGFGFVGIGIGSKTLTTGFTNVNVSNCVLSNNGEAGLFSYAGAFRANPAPYGLADSHIYISHVVACNNPGHSGGNDSGSGIELANVDQATVQYCTAYGNGTGNNSPSSGPVGIWAYNCNKVVIENNESYSNHARYKDGDGFDFDGGTTNSILQNNYSHDNDGAGIIESEFSGAKPSTGNIIRDNMSTDDGRARLQAGIWLWSANSKFFISGTQIYGNTIIMHKAKTGSPCVIHIDSWTQNISIHDNTFELASGLQFFSFQPHLTNIVVANNKEQRI